MAYVEEEGIYRCRLQIDANTGFACIDTIEHFAWDRENKCLDETKPLGGLQIVMRADAYKVLEDGSLAPERLELSLENFGITIITKTELGENTRTEVISNFVRIFGLRDASELLSIGQVPQEQLLNASFDVRVYLNKNGYKAYWFAPVGEAETKRKEFGTPTKNRSTLDKYRQKLRVECNGITGIGAASTPAAAVPPPAVKPAMPAKPAVPVKPTASALPPREAIVEINLNDVWEKWIYLNPDDAMGAAFYEALEKMFGKKDANELTANELSAFCKAHLSATAAGEDVENLPF